MPLVGFEPTISVLERAKTVRVLDHAVTAIGSRNMHADLSGRGSSPGVDPCEYEMEFVK
jgi:hypothetical protein